MPAVAPSLPPLSERLNPAENRFFQVPLLAAGSHVVPSLPEGCGISLLPAPIGSDGEEIPLQTGPLGRPMASPNRKQLQEFRFPCRREWHGADIGLTELTMRYMRFERTGLVHLAPEDIPEFHAYAASRPLVGEALPLVGVADLPPYHEFDTGGNFSEQPVCVFDKRRGDGTLEGYRAIVLTVPDSIKFHAIGIVKMMELYLNQYSDLAFMKHGHSLKHGYPIPYFTALPKHATELLPSEVFFLGQCVQEISHLGRDFLSSRCAAELLPNTRVFNDRRSPETLWLETSAAYTALLMHLHQRTNERMLA